MVAKGRLPFHEHCHWTSLSEYQWNIHSVQWIHIDFCHMLHCRTLNIQEEKWKEQSGHFWGNSGCKFDCNGRSKMSTGDFLLYLLFVVDGESFGINSFEKLQSQPKPLEAVLSL